MLCFACHLGFVCLGNARNAKWGAMCTVHCSGKIGLIHFSRADEAGLFKGLVFYLLLPTSFLAITWLSPLPLRGAKVKVGGKSQRKLKMWLQVMFNHICNGYVLEPPGHWKP